MENLSTRQAATHLPLREISFIDFNNRSKYDAICFYKSAIERNYYEKND